ncbi:hypothetical protein HZ326_21504 [Fusarium oxysporum f. sp. albedinis]|nr:hypothetical protein HZ326_21504 [Fusarium oxysporum f. sp. albedinis]
MRCWLKEASGERRYTPGIQTYCIPLYYPSINSSLGFTKQMPNAPPKPLSTTEVLVFGRPTYLFYLE